VRRMPNPDDRRAMNVELTPAGKALFPQLLAVKENVQAHLLRTFSAEEIHQFESLLKRMIANR